MFGSTEVADLEGIATHPGVFERVITISREGRDRRCAGHTAQIDRPIGVLLNREIIVTKSKVSGRLPTEPTL